MVSPSGASGRSDPAGRGIPSTFSWASIRNLREGNPLHAALVLDNLDMNGDAKTKELSAKLEKLGFGKTNLVIDGEALNVGFARASANLHGINLMPAMGANVYDILRHDTLVLTRAAVEQLEARFNG